MDQICPRCGCRSFHYNRSRMRVERRHRVERGAGGTQTGILQEKRRERRADDRGAGAFILGPSGCGHLSPFALRGRTLFIVKTLPASVAQRRRARCGGRPNGKAPGKDAATPPRAVRAGDDRPCRAP